MIKKWQQRLAALSAEMRGILDKAAAEDRDLTAEEIADFDGKKAEAAKLQESISRAEEQEKLEARLDKVEPAAASREGTGTRFNGPVPDRKTQFESFGEFMHAVCFNQNDQRLNYQEGMRGEHRTDSGAAGGFAIPREYMSGVREVPTQESIIRPLATVLPAGAHPDAELSFPALDQGEGSNMYGGVSLQWGGEGAESDDSGLKLKEVTFKPNEMIGSTVITNKLIRNWPVSSVLLEQKFRDALAAFEDVAFLRGDGKAKPLGILNSDGLLKVNRAVANQVSFADVLAMYEKLLDSGSATWIASRTLVAQLMKLKDEANNLIWATSAREGEAGTLLGIPVKFSKRNPNKGSLGDLLLGSFKEYIIKEGQAPLVSASEHVHFKSNKTVIKIVSSVDGSPALNAPVKEEDGNFYSPFVALDVPSVG